MSIYVVHKVTVAAEVTGPAVVQSQGNFWCPALGWCVSMFTNDGTITLFSSCKMERFDWLYANKFISYKAEKQQQSV